MSWKASKEELVGVKAILTCFEMVFELKIKLGKKKLGGLEIGRREGGESAKGVG